MENPGSMAGWKPGCGYGDYTSFVLLCSHSIPN